MTWCRFWNFWHNSLSCTKACSLLYPLYQPSESPDREYLLLTSYLPQSTRNAQFNIHSSEKRSFEKLQCKINFEQVLWNPRKKLGGKFKFQFKNNGISICFKKCYKNSFVTPVINIHNSKKNSKFFLTCP